MTSDVNFSLASVLAEFNSLRRADAKAETPAEDAGANRSNFDRLVSDQVAHARAKHEVQQRPIGQDNDRMMPERPAKTDRIVCGDEPAPRRETRKNDTREDRVACDDSTPARKQERSACGEEGGKKPVGEDAADEEAGIAEACETGACPEQPGSSEAGETLVVVEQPVVADVPLLTDGLLLQGEQSAEALAALNAAKAGETPVQTLVAGVVSAEIEAEGVDAATKSAAGLVQIAGEAQTKIETKGIAESEAGAVADVAAPDPTKALAKTGEPNGQTTPATASTVTAEETSVLVKAEAGEGKEGAGKSTTPNLHPARVPQFSDFLEGFGGANAVHRPADILAGLDRSVMANALNRGGEVSRPTPLQMLPIEIGMQAVRGVTNFQIRLDPAELGRVDVKLQIRDNGEVNASLIVDRVETLQMLKRDASTLQYAFEQAGLKQSADGLTFSLRGEGQNGQQQERGQQGRTNEDLDELALQAQIGEAAMRRVLIPNSSIDRMV